jgi:hypothetical protein
MAQLTGVQRTNLDILCMYSRRRSFPYLSALNGSLAVEAYKAAVTKGDAPALVLVSFASDSATADS